MKVLDETLRKKSLLVASKKKLSWGALNLLIASFFLHDLWHGYERLSYAWLWYLELILGCIFSLNAAFDLYTYMLPVALMPPTKVSPRQKELLGVNEKDAGFIIATSTPQKDLEKSRISLADQSQCSPSSMAPLTPVNLSAASWASETPNHSFAEESTSWLYQPKHSSLHLSHQRLFSLSYHGNDDETELAAILKDMEKQEHKSFLGDVPQSDSTNSSAWNYSGSLINMPDYSPLLKKFTYQLSTPPSGLKQSASLGSSDVKGTSPLTGLGKESLQHMGVQENELLEWTKNIRLWLSETIVKPLCSEIEKINNVLTAHGLEAKIGEAPLDKLRKLSTVPTIGNHVPTLSRILPYLEVSTVQEYVVQRIQSLATGGCLSEYRWNSGGSLNGKPWDESLPTDAALILHLFCTYMDDRLPQLSDRPDKKPFTGQYVIQLSDRSRASQQRNVAIVEVALHPPHFQIAASGSEAYDLPKGRSNLFYAVAFFIFLVKQRYQGMIGRLSIEQSGLNMAWIINS